MPAFLLPWRTTGPEQVHRQEMLGGSSFLALCGWDAVRGQREHATAGSKCRCSDNTGLLPVEDRDVAQVGEEAPGHVVDVMIRWQC